MAHLMTTIGSVNRLICFAILAFNVYFSANNVLPISRPFNQGGPWKYLTIWNLVLQTIYFGLAVVTSLLWSSKKNKKPGFLDVMFNSLTLPLGMLVATMFWVIYAIDRNLILPDAVRPYFPEWHNQSIHTLVLIGPLIEALCIPHKPTKRSTGLKVWLGLLIAYFINVHFFGLTYGNWVYPFLNAISYPARLLFFVVALASSLVMYFISEKFVSSLSQKQTSKKR